MKRLLASIARALGSRALPPVVIGLFLLLYIGLAFFTDETLTMLISLAGHSVILAALFALLPLNSAIRVVRELRRHLERRRVLAAGNGASPAELFDETVTLAVPTSLPELESRLGRLGYRTRRGDGFVAGWRGVGVIGGKILYLLATFCLFGGILISLTSRSSHRVVVVEREQLPASIGGGTVDKIALETPTGAILSKDLLIQVTSPSGGAQQFRLYPPSLYQGAYLYPRYLGVGLVMQFSAPDLPNRYDKHSVLNIHPPGKEDEVEMNGSPYRILFSLASPADGSDPYVTGRMEFLFKVLRGKDVVLTGSASTGGEYAKDGYRLSLPDARRLVVTDFIRDNGVKLIWLSGLLFLLSLAVSLPVMLFFPRSEMVFRSDGEMTTASSRSEARGRRHAGVFHEILDLLEARRQEKQAPEQ